MCRSAGVRRKDAQWQQILRLVSDASAYAGTDFAVVGSPIDLSANVSEAILPGGTVFQNSSPLFGTKPDPKQTAELLHISSEVTS